MSTPKRIRLRRTKGWRLPEGAKSVARPGRWGNPFFVVESTTGGWKVGDPRRSNYEPGSLTSPKYPDRPAAITAAVDLYRLHTGPMGNYELDLDEVRRELAGRDLACWCPLNQPCHADVLLEIANGGPS